ncbi:MAG: LPS export ABC transporter ATP-binding protein [Planctomycetes bacterium]|nr:LPS export ABC transporter ATP-binding protein [Planctomycetota bacterium]
MSGTEVFQRPAEESAGAAEEPRGATPAPGAEAAAAGAAAGEGAGAEASPASGAAAEAVAAATGAAGATGAAPAAQRSLFRVEGLEKSYGHRKVVDGVSFHIEAGEIVGLLGRNGAGKTTTFKMSMGMVTPQAGRVLLRGDEVTRLAMYQRARRGMGYLSQESSVFARLTVRENLLAILETRALGRADRGRRAAELLEEFGLTRVAEQRAYTLSGGERRRLEIARALTTDPVLLLLDEPFSGVDPIAVQEIQGLIRALRARGIGILLTDHNVRESLSVTDRSYIIDNGKILAGGPPRAIVENPLVRKVYLGERFTL